MTHTKPSADREWIRSRVSLTWHIAVSAPNTIGYSNSLCGLVFVAAAGSEGGPPDGQPSCATCITLGTLAVLHWLVAPGED